jgi:hypothetical protein
MPDIFVSEGELEESIGALCDKYLETHKAITVPGEALLVDLRGKEPRLESVSPDYKLPEHR